mmetsp:Transcript_42261/g.40484  ORF Transcript_42261/g.40484 Transcript_42261/m.40484 type:complete len:129 (+) Transcript_42261:1071-1457(+)
MFPFMLSQLRSIAKDKFVKFEDLIKYKLDVVEQSLFLIDRQLPFENIIPANKIKLIMDFYRNYAKNSVALYLSSDFYEHMPEQLKHKLVGLFVKKFYKDFYHFFNDVPTGFKAETRFIRNIVSNLEFY